MLKYMLKMILLMKMYLNNFFYFYKIYFNNLKGNFLQLKIDIFI